MRETDHHQDYL